MPDYDDCKKLRALVEDFNSSTRMMNLSTTKWMLAETQLNLGIIQQNISAAWAWKKQVLELCKADESYASKMLDFYQGKENEKVCKATLKALENEMNVLKKIYEVTPT